MSAIAIRCGTSCAHLQRISYAAPGGTVPLPDSISMQRLALRLVLLMMLLLPFHPAPFISITLHLVLQRAAVVPELRCYACQRVDRPVNAGGDVGY